MGSFKGAIRNSSTSAPGKQPISNNFKGILSKPSSDMIPLYLSFLVEKYALSYATFLNVRKIKESEVMGFTIFFFSFFHLFIRY